MPSPAADLRQVRGEAVARQRAVVLGHPGGDLRHLPQPHHGPVHRVPGQPGAVDIIL